MKVKALKKYLELYDDEKELIVKGASGIVWDIKEDMIAQQTLTDEKREVCKLHIK